MIGKEHMFTYKYVNVVNRKITSLKSRYKSQCDSLCRELCKENYRFHRNSEKSVEKKAHRFFNDWYTHMDCNKWVSVCWLQEDTVLLYYKTFSHVLTTA